MGSFFERMPYANFHELNLEWVLQEMKRTAEKVDGLLDDVEAIVKAAEDRIDDKVTAQINAAMDEIETVITDFQDRINQQIQDSLDEMNRLLVKADNMLGLVDDKLAAQAAENLAVLNKFQLEINKEIGTLKDEIRRYDVEIKRYIEVRFQELIDMIPDVTMVWIHNPLTGIAESVEDAMEFCNNYWLEYGMPVDLFDVLGFKVDEFTPEVWDFDTRFKEGYVAPGMAGSGGYHGRTSEWEADKELDRRTVPFGIRVGEFDDLQYTVGDFDNLGVKVDRFDKWGLWEFVGQNEVDGGYIGNISLADGKTGVSACGVINVKEDVEQVGEWRLLCKIGRSNYADGYVRTLYAGKRLLQGSESFIVCGDDGNFQTTPIVPWETLEYRFGVLSKDKYLWLVCDCGKQVVDVPFSFFWEYNEVNG